MRRTEQQKTRRSGVHLSVAGLALTCLVPFFAAETSGCAHDKPSEALGFGGFVLVPLATDAGRLAAEDDVDASGAADASADGSAARDPFALEPTPPNALGCQAIVTCRAPLASPVAKPLSPELERCANEVRGVGAISLRETRESRAKGTDQCCYVAYRGCLHAGD